MTRCHPSAPKPAAAIQLIRSLSVTLAALSVHCAAIAATGELAPNRSTPNYVRFDAEISGRIASPVDALTAVGFGDMIAGGDLREVSRVATYQGYAVRYGQYYAGLPVIGSRVVVKLNRRGRALSIHSSIAEWIADADPDFAILREQAESIALGVIDVLDLRAEIHADRVVLPRGGVPRFCWLVKIAAWVPLGDWEIYIDAAEGSVLLTQNRLQSISGSGLVFNPDPVTATRDTSLRDEDDRAEAVPEEAYSEVELLDITQGDSLYILAGPWADCTRRDARAALVELAFDFDREDDRFEEVMAYHHIDRRARYVIDLGFDDLPPSPQPVIVNAIEDDASFFSPHTGIIFTGEGGVDDAEDADVLIHEYSHALLHQILPDWRGGETGILTEGWCDYQAGDYSISIEPDFQPMLLYNWDGHNEFWDGRRLDSDLTYAETRDLDVHSAGQMWSSLLTEVRLSAQDAEMWNRVVFDHLFALADSATVGNAASALLDSDGEIAESTFRRYIVRGCERRGIVPLGFYSPLIEHQPLGDTEDVASDREVIARIASAIPLDPDRIWVVHRFGEGEMDTVAMTAVLNRPDYYRAMIPATGEAADVGYHLIAADTLGVFSTHPAGAPFEQHYYRAGPDIIPPVIAMLDTLHDTVFPDGELIFSARVSDNIAVGGVFLEWYYANMEPGGARQLEPTEDDSAVFAGRMRWAVEDEHLVRYRVRAVDIAAEQNTALSGMLAFMVTRSAAVEDFETANRRWLLSDWTRSAGGAYQGDWILADREPRAEWEPPRNAVAALNESWDMSSFGSAELRFWETHIFDGEAGEYGVFETLVNGGVGWTELMRFEGVVDWWTERQINLERFCAQDSPPFRVRFRTVTPDGAAPLAGWHIDDLRLMRGNIVTLRGEPASMVSRSSLGEPFPNPTNGFISFDYRLHSPGALTITDLTGRHILSRPLPQGRSSMSLALERLPTGVYMIKLQSGGESLHRRLLLLR